jgi:hypothetical protein
MAELKKIEEEDGSNCCGFIHILDKIPNKGIENRTDNEDEG